MRSILAGLRRLVIPWGAGPTTPRAVFGPDVPAELAAYYLSALGGRVVFATIFHTGTTKYFYDAWIVFSNSAWRARGIVFNNTDVLETEIEFNNVGASSENTVDIGARHSVAWRVATDARILIDGVSIGRGLRSRIDSVVNSAAVGAEAIVLTAPAMTYRQDRAYEYHFGGLTFGSVANTVLYQIRRTNLVGAIKGVHRWPGRAGGALADWMEGTGYVRHTGADVSDNMVLTLQASAGTATQAGGATFPRYFEIRDCGAAADYGNAPVF